MTNTLKFLAFETSTDMMSVALSCGAQTWHVHAQGGAQASAQLIPTIHNLLAQAKLSLSDLSALVMGQGPGSFTGLRTACSVAQGLALGAHLKVIPVDTLMVVAEDARASLQAPLTAPVSVVMDARMGEVYGGQYLWHPLTATWQATLPLQVGPPAQVVRALIAKSPSSRVFAGNGLTVYPEALNQLPENRSQSPLLCVPAVPHALALLRLAPALWAAGQAVAPEDVQPLYIRDKVAQTTAEREAIKAAKVAQEVQALQPGLANPEAT